MYIFFLKKASPEQQRYFYEILRFFILFLTFYCKKRLTATGIIKKVGKDSPIKTASTKRSYQDCPERPIPQSYQEEFSRNGIVPIITIGITAQQR